MSELPIKSPLQLDVRQDGRVLASIDGVSISGPLEIVPDEGPVRDWLEELGLPKDWDQLTLLATSSEVSHRVVKFLLVDESATTLPGARRFTPSAICVQYHAHYSFTLAHLGLEIGRCEILGLYPPGVFPEAEGDCLLGLAYLYDSALATAAWNGIERKIFTHVSGVFARNPTDPPGKETLIEVGLTDLPGCPGARILKMWEE